MSPAALNLADRVGLGLSFACALHCIAGPLVLTIIPISGLQSAESADWLFLPAVVPVFAGIVVKSRTLEWRAPVLTVLAAAAALLIVSLFVGGVLEQIATATAALTLGATRLACRWSAHACTCHEEADHALR